jgi:hypothetical protein
MAAGLFLMERKKEVPEYVVNRKAQANGDHEVHRMDTCKMLPASENRDPLGVLNGCRSAVIAAKVKGYARANGCAWCSPECHTT